MSKEVNSIVLVADDKHIKKCGEILLTEKGYMIFHCTLCEEKYQDFEKYAIHVEEVHKIVHYGKNTASNEPYEDTSRNIEMIDDWNDEQLYFIESEEPAVEKYDFGSLDEEEFMTEKLKTRKHSKLKKISKDEKKPSLEPIVTAFIKIDENSDSNTDIEESTSQIPITKSLNDESSKVEIRPIRKKTNYFPDPNEIRPHKCPYCEATFKNYDSFYKHKARHQTEKTHPCPQCPKMFYDAIDVKKHQRSHTNVRPFLCSKCGKTFISSDKLKDHIRRHTNQRDYNCTVCNKAFFNSGLLAKHKAVHSNNKPFECNICSSKFTFKKSLTEHTKIHENKREYKCDLCEADFNQLAGLFSHKKTKHKVL